MAIKCWILNLYFFYLFQLSIDIGNEVKYQNKMLGEMVSDGNWCYSLHQNTLIWIALTSNVWFSSRTRTLTLLEVCWEPPLVDWSISPGEAKPRCTATCCCLPCLCLSSCTGWSNWGDRRTEALQDLSFVPCSFGVENPRRDDENWGYWGVQECFLSTGQEVEPLIDNVQYETKICPNPPLVSPEGKG